MGRLPSLPRTAVSAVLLAVAAVGLAGCGDDPEVAAVTLTRPAAPVAGGGADDQALALGPLEASSRSSFGFGADGTEIMALGPLERSDVAQLVTDAVRVEGDRVTCQVHLLAGAASVLVDGVVVATLRVDAGEGELDVRDLGDHEVALLVPAEASALLLETDAVPFRRARAADVACAAAYVPGTEPDS